MSGPTGELAFPVIAAVASIAAATDLARGRIPNLLTFPAFFLGVFAAFFHGGWMGGVAALAAAALGFVLTGWMFAFGTLGAGDVKLLMALGAWGGPRFTLETAVVALFVGAAMGAVVLAWRGKLPGFARRMWDFALTLMVRELKAVPPKIDRSQTLPFGLPLAVAAIWCAWDSPLAGWMLPW